MKKEKNVSKVSKVKLNVNYVEFIGRLMRDKLVEMNKEKLRVMYCDSVKVKSWKNINRVSERVKREKLNSVLESVLRDLKIDKVEFFKVSDKIVEKIREKKVGSYRENE